MFEIGDIIRVSLEAVIGREMKGGLSARISFNKKGI